MNISIDKIFTQQQMEDCLAIRRLVFIEEQNVPEELEIDGLDVEAVHYHITVEQKTIGTARVRDRDNKAKIERVVLLAEFQGKGYGKKLMRYILDDIKKDKKASQVTLSAQTYLIPFYQGLGFTLCSGEEYMDAGIAHQDMYLLL